MAIDRYQPSTSEKLDFLIETMKGVEWERAKGSLRALVTAQGRTTSSLQGDVERKMMSLARWEKLESLVNAFIKEVEDAGLHE